MSAFVFYRKLVALNTKEHANLRLSPIPSGYSFARETMLLPLAASEIVEAAREMVVVFVASANGQMAPSALLGLRERENLFVSQEGKWAARYVPAFVRRYPFLLAMDPGSKQWSVCIDEQAESLNVDDGTLLIASDGTPTDLLTDTLEFLNGCQAEFAQAAALAEELKAMGLLKDLTAEFRLSDGRMISLTGFSVIDEEKLKALDEAKVLALFQRGVLGLIYAHLQSLGNLARLPEMLVSADSAQRGAA
jgi:hypothetical protein